MAQERRTRAEIFQREGRLDEAIALLTALVRDFPDDDSHALALAWVLLDAGRRDEATALLETLADKELSRPTFTGFAYDELVRLYGETGRFDRLVALCDRAVASHPDDLALWHTLGRARWTAGDARGAAEAFRHLLELDNEAEEVYCELGQVEACLGRFDEAEIAFARAAALDPEQAPVFFCRAAEAFRAGGDPQRAEAALETSIRLRPEEPAYRLALADILLDSGRCEEADAAVCEAIRLRPGAAGAFWNRFGHSLKNTGRLPEAAQAFTRAAEAEPDNPFYALYLQEASAISA